MTDEELDEAIHDTEEGVHRLLEGIKNHPNKVVRDAFEESVPKILKELDRLKKLKLGQQH